MRKYSREGRQEGYKCNDQRGTPTGKVTSDKDLRRRGNFRERSGKCEGPGAERL